MSIVASGFMLNEEEFIDDFFRINLPLVDRMIIVEGGVVGHPFCDRHGNSIDNTCEKLIHYADKYKDKVELIITDRKWKSKQEQQNVILKYLDEGDFKWGIAADEFYMPDTRKKIESILEKYPDLTEMTLPMIHFFGDDKHMIVDKEFKTPNILQRHQRFFKYNNGLYYVNHPTINDLVRNVDTFFDDVYTKNKINLGMSLDFRAYKYRRDLMGIWDILPENTIYTYHYAFIRNPVHQIMKSIYYLMRDRDMMPMDAFEYVKDKVRELDSIYGYIEQIHRSNDVVINEFNGDHPLSYRKWNYSDSIDFDIILNSIEDFNEIPIK